ncbi:hypothetical protein CEUSTIGMA_g2955.t1 [Chlamydomonas eustigma]|uniref:Uncharacterized protein n=1 Tax=Chlamydomonas eustigma TaxID=1157962 RepID=A0A250WY35_9CHLO|nr:hypothetical protein CEUSTIGMA_g2955.t1 [Chlamydomonas eustigma]|eukprot:GAX75512.1 hypothetical protein CEUSTIGMA_g2955.t1 [Chlamydomonas eustigma]
MQVPNTDDVLRRLDIAVEIIQREAPDSKSWHGAVLEFAECSTQLQASLRKNCEVGATTSNLNARKTSLIKEITSLQSEIKSKEQLLDTASQQVRKWRTVCDKLTEQHEKSMFSGIG